MKPLLVAVLACALSAGCAYRAAEHPISLLGQPIPATAAAATIVLDPDTRWVNVTGGDAVRFLVGDREFGWQFQVATVVRSFDLARVAPPGMLTHPVIAYVAPDPSYRGGDGGERND